MQKFRRYTFFLCPYISTHNTLISKYTDFSCPKNQRCARPYCTMITSLNWKRWKVKQPPPTLNLKLLIKNPSQLFSCYVNYNRPAAYQSLQNQMIQALKYAMTFPALLILQVKKIITKKQHYSRTLISKLCEIDFMNLELRFMLVYLVEFFIE